MKKNLLTIILAAMVVAGCLLIESSTFVGLCLIACVGFVLVMNDLNKVKAYERAKENANNIDYLLDCVEFGEWNLN